MLRVLYGLVNFNIGDRQQGGEPVKVADRLPYNGSALYYAGPPYPGRHTEHNIIEVGTAVAGYICGSGGRVSKHRNGVAFAPGSMVPQGIAFVGGKDHDCVLEQILLFELFYDPAKVAVKVGDTGQVLSCHSADPLFVDSRIIGDLRIDTLIRRPVGGGNREPGPVW